MMSGRDPNNDVQERLENELREHETRIEELEQQLQEDRNCSTKKMKELEDEKKVLENEVNELKKKIKLLDDEVRYFSTKPAITDLKREVKEKDTQMDSMEKYFELKLNAVTSQLKEDLKKNMVETKELKKSQKKMGEEMQFFVKKSQKQEEDLKEYMAKTDELEKSRNILYIGQLCANVMAGIYRVVLPVYFERDDYKQPHLRVIDQKIDELYQNRREKREAHQRWTKLQEKIDAELVDFMEKMLAERHEVAHPYPSNENELKDIASKLPGQKQKHFEKVIEISREMFPTLLVAF